jgi:hypothetical protein
MADRSHSHRVLASYVQRKVLGRTGGEYDGVCMAAQLGEVEIFADVDGAEESHPIIGEDRIDPGGDVVESLHTGHRSMAEQSIRLGGAFDEVDADRQVGVVEERGRHLEACRSGTHDRYS